MSYTNTNCSNISWSREKTNGDSVARGKSIVAESDISVIILRIPAGEKSSFS